MVKLTREKINMVTSKIQHLTREEIIKNGSIFTPEHIVAISKLWLSSYIKENDYVIDFGVGYGAFISSFLDLSENCIATDVDEKSIQLVNEHFPQVKTFLENSLIDVTRKKYGIPDDAKLIIIGNPPYNDVTSQYKKGQKGSFEMEDNLKSRDLGISFLKMYSLLNPDIICVLHPLSYLIKKTNFNSLSFFKDKYKLKRGIVFSSKEFESIKKTNTEFPVVLAFYEKNYSEKFEYEDIENFEFEILDNNKLFKLKKYDTIDKKVRKYPTKNKSNKDLQFYTMRDINALKRNRTFLTGKCNNGVKVELEDLYKYAWIDYFKNHFNHSLHYLFGNLSPLYDEIIESSVVKKELISYILNTNDVVLDYYKSKNMITTVKDYYKIENLLISYPKLNKIIDKINNF
ncbi:MAG: hypothetical protein ACOX26_00125 [Bacilli bacterium]|jgi:methylase of polypeptide subunit release factors